MRRKLLSIAAVVQIFLLFQQCPGGFAADWVDPYFTDPQVKGVTFIETSGPNNHHLTMTVEEEIKWPFSIAIINYKGTDPPTISSYILGDRNVLNLDFVKTSDDLWALQVTQRLDYEALNAFEFSFVLSVPEIESLAIKPRISFTLLNIFDNPPRLDSLGECIIDELKDPFLTECMYNLYDADGMEGNRHTFAIDGQNGEDQLFEFEAFGIPSKYEQIYKLRTKQELEFEKRQLYIFNVMVTDAGGMQGTSRVIVEVEDLPNLPPKWVQPFVSDRFDEKQAREYQVIATDGDTKLNKEVNYALRFDDVDADKDWTRDITIDQKTGGLKVAALNRDILQQEVFKFYIIAYEFENQTERIESSATIILNDINDNFPLITIDQNTIHIWEETFETLNFEEFFVNDIDLGQNAQYELQLREVGENSEPYSTAFTVIPGSGYQMAEFIVSVINAGLLDYENQPWQSFEVMVRSEERFNASHVDEQKFSVALDNWNDEEPIFQNTPYVFSVPETIEKGGYLGKVTALDRDIDDKVEYFLVGYLSDSILVNSEGELHSNVDQLLNYQRQTSVVVQIAARDTLTTTKPGEVLHTVYEQVVINVEDVNNITPELRMPRTSPSVKENSAGGTVITSEIEATDADTTADLELTILWDESYATKNGREVDKAVYKGCFIIEADKTNPNKVIGTLKINPDYAKDVDYEEYEVLYLTIHVKDLNWKLGIPDSTGVITVRIEDENDNPPVFVDGTADVNRTVIEASLESTIIGSVLATDIDGPEFNVVRYFIEPLGDTPPDWVRIQTVTGELTVAHSDEIDCDTQRIEYLNYRIIAADNDNTHETAIDIQIYIIDTNNKEPEFIDFVDQVQIYEDQVNGLVVLVAASDKDRDPHFRDFTYQIDYSGYVEQRDLFAFAENTGELVVQLQNGQVLDRDEGVTQHVITVVVTDNRGLGVVNSHRDRVTVVLLDVNDNAPVLPSPSSFSPSIMENVFTASSGSHEITDHPLIATDKDEGVNAEVSFRIISIKAAGDNANPLPDIEGVFDIKSERKENRGTLVVQKSLQGFYGKWEIVIEAYDHGDEGVSKISLSTQETYTITIQPFNFEAPKITFPIAGQTLRLRYPPNSNTQLYTFPDGKPLQAFTATDPDGGVFGEVEFSVTGSSHENDDSFFQFVGDGRNQYQLQVKSAGIEARVYHINIEARDGGGLTHELTDLRLVFVDINGNPVFENNHFETVIVENDAEAKVTLPQAVDPKNEGITDPSEPKYEIYYFLQSPSDIFVVDRDSGVLSLKRALEWTRETEEYEIVIIATNAQSGPIEPIDPNSKLTVKIIVEDVNDKPPKFELERYGAGVTTDDPVNKIILRVRAIDPDKDDVVTYHILSETMEASPSLSSIKDVAFSIVENTDPGELQLRVKILPSYSGYFTFKIQARDLVDHTDETTVRVYIIAESNRVSFIFRNTLNEVEDQTSYISSTLSTFFQYDCSVDDVQPYDDGASSAQNQIEVRAHFVDNDGIPVDGDVIRMRTNEIGLITEISVQMYLVGLNLFEIPGTATEQNLSNKEDILRILLIVLSVIFSVIIAGLIAFFVFHMRRLNRQLKAYGASDLDTAHVNRREAPLTNVFSVEGTNPAINGGNTLKKSMFDEESIQSDGDSDIIGFEDHPDFVKDGIDGVIPHTEILNVARIQDIRKNNNNNNPMANGGTIKSRDLDNDSLFKY